MHPLKAAGVELRFSVTRVAAVQRAALVRQLVRVVVTVTASCAVAFAAASSSSGLARATGGGSVAASDRLVFLSDRGHGRWFAMDADGSNVRALKPPFDTAEDVAWSPDASHVAYTAKEFGPLIVMRSDGTRQVQVAKKDATDFTWSPDGTLLAYELLYDRRVFFVRSDGTPAGGLALPPRTGFESWVGNDRVSLMTSGDKWVADRVGGGNRVDLPDVGDDYAWSPSGKQLAYLSSSKDTLCLVNADGSGRRCLSSAEDVVDLGWSPSGDRIALSSYPELFIVDPATMRVREIARIEPYAEDLTWSSDATRIAFTVDYSQASDIWVVHPDGSGLHRLASPGYDGGPRWVPASRLEHFEGAKAAPIGPAFLVSARTLEVHGAVDELAADGTRAAALTHGTPDHYQHIVIWKPGAQGLRQLVQRSPEASTWSGVALAGDLAAWINEGGGNYIEQVIETSVRGVYLGNLDLDVHTRDQDGNGNYVGNLVGDGGLLAWNEWSQQGDTSPADKTSLRAWYQRRERVVLGGPDSFRVVAADGTRLLVQRADGSLVVVGVAGNVVQRFPARQGIRGAGLSGTDVVVVSQRTLTDFDLATGKVKRNWKVSPEATLADVQSGVAAYVAGTSITLVDLRNGTSSTLSVATSRPPLAQLEPAGLFYAYAIGGKSSVRLLPFADIRKRLSR